MASAKITRICQFCETSFQIYPSVLKRIGRGRFCSKKCQDSVGQTSLVCLECGQTFIREIHRVNQGVKYFCGRKCSKKHGQPLENKFWAKIEKTESCWLWQGRFNNKGYGQTHYKGRIRLAHCVSYEIHNKISTINLKVRHTCDNPPCVNPNHLELGTQKENMTDCANKNRIQHGTKHYLAKLTNEMVREARKLRAEQGITYATLAKQFNVSRNTISHAIRGLSWKRVT